MIDNAVYEMGAKLQLCREGEKKLKIINNRLEKENENVLKENLDLKNDMLLAKEQNSILDSELLAVKIKFKKLKNKYDKLILGEDSSSNKRSGGLPLPNARFPLNPSPFAFVPVNALPLPADTDTTTTPTKKLSRSRALFGRRSPKGKMGNEFHEDPSFVPETMKMAPSPSLLNPLDTQEVPESPEKHSSSMWFGSQTTPPSPVLRNSRGKALQIKHKNKSNGPTVDGKDLSKAHFTASNPGKKTGSSDLLVTNVFRKKISPQVAQTNARQNVSSSETFSDNRVAPGFQSTIDKKANQDLDQKFPPNKRPKQDREPSDKILPKNSTFLDDSSSDFESQNLLKKLIIYEDFALPPVHDVGEKAKNELTKSQSKRPKNQKQSKLDNTDKKMEEVLKLSKETFELEQKRMSTSSKHNSQNSREAVQHNSREPVFKRGREPIEELEFSPDEAGPSSPKYAYINRVVRKKDERKKLRGFDCYECEDYYKSKLEEGYSEEEVQKMMNDCSKHRGKYKPSLTPEKFWDPEMIEGDPESPRNKTQVQTKPFNNRARRRALNKEKNKVGETKKGLNIDALTLSTE